MTLSLNGRRILPNPAAQTHRVRTPGHASNPEHSTFNIQHSTSNTERRTMHIEQPTLKLKLKKGAPAFEVGQKRERDFNEEFSRVERNVAEKFRATALTVQPSVTFCRESIRAFNPGVISSAGQPHDLISREG